jgi:L-rhamnose isomerase
MLNPKTYAVNPKNWRIFKVWISIQDTTYDEDPRPPRLTSYREMGRVCSNFYRKLSENNLIKFSGAHGNFDLGPEVLQVNSHELNYSPRIGNVDPYLYVSGHYYSTRVINDPYSTKPVFSGGVLYNIQDNSNPMVKAPAAELVEEVLEIKNIMTNAMDLTIPSYLSYTLDKIDYLGVIFGSRGLHFPK